MPADPVNVDSDHYNVEFENDRVRVPRGQSSSGGSQVLRASANVAPSGIWSAGKPEAASSRPLKLKKETRAVISQIAGSSQPTFRSNFISSLSTRLGVSVSLLA